MNLTELKEKPINELVEMAEAMGIENVARSRKQDVIFALLKVLTRHGEGVAADGVLEILPDGFGFLRAAEASYLAGPDDVYISPSQIRRFNLRTGDHLAGRIRWPLMLRELEEKRKLPAPQLMQREGELLLDAAPAGRRLPSGTASWSSRTTCSAAMSRTATSARIGTTDVMTPRTPGAWWLSSNTSATLS